MVLVIELEKKKITISSKVDLVIAPGLGQENLHQTMHDFEKGGFGYCTGTRTRKSTLNKRVMSKCWEETWITKGTTTYCSAIASAGDHKNKNVPRVYNGARSTHRAKPYDWRRDIKIILLRADCERNQKSTPPFSS